MKPELLISSAADWALRATLIAIAAWLVPVLFRIRSARARHLHWAGVVLVLLALPVLHQWGPAIPIRAVSGPVIARVVSHAPGEPADMSIVSGLPQTLARLAAERRREVIPSHPFLPGLLVVLYGVVSGFLMLRLAVGTVLARRLVRQSVASGDKLINVRCASPVTVGWFRPVILLPPTWKEWPASKLNAVLRHESEHARWRDPLVQWLALLQRALFWFHPLAWWLERHLNQLAEEACDHAALSHGADPADYADWLVQFARAVARSHTRRNELPAMMMAGTLKPERLTRLFSFPASGTPLSRAILAGLVCCVLCIGIGAGRIVDSAPPAAVTTAATLTRPPEERARIRRVSANTPARERLAHRRMHSSTASRSGMSGVAMGDRVGAIYLDLASMPEPARSRAIDSTAAFVANRIQPGYQVALLVNRGSGIETAQELTSNQSAILAAMERLKSETNPGVGSASEADPFTSFERAVGTVPEAASRKDVMWVVNQSVIANVATHQRWRDTRAAMEREGVRVMVAGMAP